MCHAPFRPSSQPSGNFNSSTFSTSLLLTLKEREERVLDTSKRRLSAIANNAHDYVIYYQVCCSCYDASGTFGRLGWTDIPPDAGD